MTESDDDIQFVDDCWSVLVADDSKPCREAMAAALSEYRYPVSVTEVSTADALLKELASNRFDLAFVDIAFGTASGLDAIARARESGLGTFVVVVSGSRASIDREAAKALGAYEFLDKPLAASDVHQVLDAYQRIKTPTVALLIDDSGTARKLMARVFERSVFNVHVEEAADGITGLETFARAPTDFVFIDLNMPGLDGPATARVLRAFNDKVKIVIVSGDAAGLSSVRGAMTLRKPFTPRQLDALLHDLYGIPQPF